MGMVYYQYIRPLLILGIYKQDCKMCIGTRDAKHATGKY